MKEYKTVEYRFYYYVYYYNDGSANNGTFRIYEDFPTLEKLLEFKDKFLKLREMDKDGEEIDEELYKEFMEEPSEGFVKFRKPYDMYEIHHSISKIKE